MTLNNYPDWFRTTSQARRLVGELIIEDHGAGFYTVRPQTWMERLYLAHVALDVRVNWMTAGKKRKGLLS